MSRPGEEVTRLALKLLPHQAALVETVFDPNSKRIILLRAAPGLGKGTALVAVAARLMREQPSARMLILAPSPLHFQFAQRLQNENVPSLLVDRYTFRELLDRAKSEAIWPSGAVVVMSIDFAKQADIRDSLASIQWDLLMVEESHRMTGARADIIRLVNANRVVLASATPAIDTGASQLAGEDFTAVDWPYGLISDADGKPLITAPNVVVHQSVFSLDADELRLRTAALDFARTLAAGTSHVKGSMLRLCLESSPAAFEGALRRIVQRTTTAVVDLDEPEEPDDLELSDSAPIGSSSLTGNEISDAAGNLLQGVEEIVSDSKLDVLRSCLTSLMGADGDSKRIVILTNFVATLYYLAADLEERGVAYKVIHGGLGAEERRKSLELFSNGNTVLLATPAILTYGVDLPGVTDLVLYDIPRRTDVLLSIFHGLNRIGKRTNLNLYLLTDHEDSAYVLREALEQIAGQASQNKHVSGS